MTWLEKMGFHPHPSGSRVAKPCNKGQRDHREAERRPARSSKWVEKWKNHSKPAIFWVKYGDEWVFHGEYGFMKLLCLKIYPYNGRLIGILNHQIPDFGSPSIKHSNGNLPFSSMLFPANSTSISKGFPMGFLTIRLVVQDFATIHRRDLMDMNDHQFWRMPLWKRLKHTPVVLLHFSVWLVHPEWMRAQYLEVLVEWIIFHEYEYEYYYYYW